MIWNDIYVSGTGSFLPPMRPIKDLQIDGFPNDRAIAQSDYVSFTKTDIPAIVTATRAATHALAVSEHESGHISILIYAGIMGDLHHIAPVCHVQRILQAPEALAFELGSASNGGTQALEVAANLMTADTSTKAALVCAGYRHPGNYLSRWQNGIVFGDGAAATVLSREGGIARLISGSHSSVPELEILAKNQSTEPMGFELSDIGLGPYLAIIARMFQSVIGQALKEAETSLEEIKHFAVTSIGLPSIMACILDPIDIPIHKTSWRTLRETGHVGPCDPLLGLDYLVEQKALNRGDKFLLIGAGFGYRATCIVMEMTMD